MLGSLDASLARQVKKGRIDDAAAAEVRGRVSAVTALDELAACDLVLESIVEDLAAKQELFRELDRVCTPSAILATNTSTLPVVEMAMVTDRPERVCGIHYFNPATAMSLVELVPAITTSDATLAEARAFVEACGKTAVTVKDQAGFVVNALLFPYLNNAVRLFDAGVASRDDIDAAMKGGCNFPMGPLELLDLVGLDTSLAILDALYAEFHDANFAPAPLLRRMVAGQRLGRKSGAGFYEYTR
jgi:3-hydroxybutyryl-CoA dehydrogenase